jgi:hypothetical protein
MFLAIKFNGDVRQNIADSASDHYEGLIYMVLLEYIPEADVTMIYCFDITLEQIKELFCMGDWFWNHAEMQTRTTEPLDENLNSLLDFKEVTRTFYPSDKYSVLEPKVITLKKYSIRLERMYPRISFPEDFDSLDELKENLKNKYQAKRLIPIKYTPWDSINFYEKQSCEVDNPTLLYLYRHSPFEFR